MIASGARSARRGLIARLPLGAAALAAAVAPASAVTPAPARAAVRAPPGQIVVTAGNGVAAMVQRDPFRLRFVSAGGATALGEVAPDGSLPVVLAPTADPVAPGTDSQTSGQRYAPLSFLVGQETVQQYEGLVWGGNLLSGERSGVQYAAQAVLQVTPEGGGVRLVLSTDDPTGRELIVTITPTAGAIRVSALPDPASGVAMMSDAFDSPAGEAFHGFGGRHDTLDQHGQALSSFVEEENLPGPPGSATPAGATQLFPNGPAAAYYPQPQFISSAGYGFLLNQPELARFRMDSDRPDAWSVAASAAHLDYVVAPGRPARAIARLTALTGRQPAPPAWALGPMLDRLVKNFGETTSDYTASVFADLADLRRYRMPITAYRLEGWGLPSADGDGLYLHPDISFADQTRVVRELRARHIHPLAYLRPWITPGSAPDQAGLTARQADGQSYVTTGTAGQQIALLDFTNPAAVRFWQREVDKVLDLGFDGFMQDFGEEVLFDMHFADGETGVTMHNRYLILYMRATRQALLAYQRRHPRRTLWFFNRAGYSGIGGSTGFEGGNFPGDESTDWSASAGLASLTPDMLNRAIGGAYGFATDIGGYYDYTTPPTTKELFLRWAEWAALSPIFRLHGSGRSGTHTPWSFDAQTVSVYRALSRLHQRAAPLILRLWRQADRTGIPPTRPLWLQYPRDPVAAGQDQEWMLGDDVLVAPVVTEGATSRQVYFPAGCWREPATGQRRRGPLSAAVTAPLTRLPYFVRCGSAPFAAAPRSSRRRARLRSAAKSRHGRVLAT